MLMGKRQLLSELSDESELRLLLREIPDVDKCDYGCCSVVVGWKERYQPIE